MQREMRSEIYKLILLRYEGRNISLNEFETNVITNKFTCF